MRLLALRCCCAVRVRVGLNATKHARSHGASTHQIQYLDSRVTSQCLVEDAPPTRGTTCFWGPWSLWIHVTGIVVATGAVAGMCDLPGANTEGNGNSSSRQTASSHLVALFGAQSQ